jgi:hypothetical protein
VQDIDTSADEMYSRIMYQSCAFVSISWLNRKEWEPKVEVCQITEPTESQNTHQKLEAILR